MCVVVVVCVIAIVSVWHTFTPYQSQDVASGLAVLDTPISHEDRAEAWGQANASLARANRRNFRRKLERYRANAFLDCLDIRGATTTKLGLQRHGLTTCPNVSRYARSFATHVLVQ